MVRAGRWAIDWRRFFLSSSGLFFVSISTTGCAIVVEVGERALLRGGKRVGGDGLGLLERGWGGKWDVDVEILRGSLVVGWKKFTYVRLPFRGASVNVVCVT